MEWGDSKTIRTPEHVALTYSLAGLGTRFAAMFLDTFLQGVVTLAVFLALGAGGELMSTLEEDTNGAPPASSWVIALVILVLFGIVWGYFMFWEAIWSGQTPGKYLCGIRVMRDGGFPIDFRAAFIRNVLRYVDFLPLLYGVGALSMFLSKDSKRLGDYAAGTIVVVSRSQARKPAPSAPTPAATYKLLGDPSLLSLRAVNRDQFLVVERFLSRRDELPEKIRTQMSQQLAIPLFPLLGVPAPVPPYPYEQFLSEFADAYRNRPGA